MNNLGMTRKEIQLFKGMTTKAKDQQLTSMIRGLMDEIARREEIPQGEESYQLGSGECPRCQVFMKEATCVCCGWPERIDKPTRIIASGEGIGQ